ncbi:MAG: preprotein translocase subunit SecE [Rhodospirillales bacterium]
MAKTNPAQFVREVRQEASKVTWPTRRETGISTAMVFVFCTIAAIFFLLVDQVLQLGVKFLFGLGG